MITGCGIGKEPESPKIITETKTVPCPEVMVKRTCPELPIEPETPRESRIRWPVVQTRNQCLIKIIQDNESLYQNCIKRNR